MSKQIALDNIWLRPTSRWAHTEYSLNYHTDYIRRVTGLDPGDPASGPALNRAWDIDFLWSVNDGLHGDWLARGRATDMGHAEYAADGSDLHLPSQCPFTEAEEVWAFDAVAEYGLPDFDAQVQAYEQWWQAAQAANPEQVVTGGYYKSIVSGAIQTFGWEMLLLGASEPAKMERVLDSFFRYTLFHMEAWARTSVEVIIQHDDFVWTAGAFMHPEYYRAVIIPRYAELWQALRAAGKKILFCSDGTFLEFAEDVAAAGADGFIFEPSNDFGAMVERFGRSHVLVGSAVDCREMAFNSWDTVRTSLERTLTLAAQCRGVILAVGNHIPANVPPAMLDQYITYLQAHWAR
jgi:hypothetical protein